MYTLLVSVVLAAPQDTRVSNWQADLDFFAENFKSKHVKPFEHIKEDEFNQAIAVLKMKIGQLTDQQIVIGLWQLLGRVGDGHSRVMQPRSIPFRQYRLAVTWLQDGWYVFAIDNQHKNLLKGKLVAIGTTPIEEATAKVRTLYANENTSAERTQLQRNLVMVEPLHALGLVEDVNRATFTIRTVEGKDEQVTLAPLERGQPSRFAMAVRPESWPEHLKQNRSQYGSAWLDDRKVLYVWYDRCADNPNLPIAEWTKKVLADVKEKAPAKVIIDLRRNGGGNSALLWPLTAGLKPTGEAGSLFALIGPGTYSSAMMNANELRNNARAILVGQPTGGSPNSPGEVKTFTLPHSKCAVQYSSKIWRRTNDNANTIAPDIAVEPSPAGFFADRDEVLEAVLKK